MRLRSRLIKLKYDILVPKLDKNIFKLTEEETAAYFEWFMEQIPERVAYVSQVCAKELHISVERMNYSVPFEYIKQKVDVRLTRAAVEVFYGGNRICSHPRLYGRFNQYSTIQEHMPPEHQKYVQ